MGVVFFDLYMFVQHLNQAAAGFCDSGLGRTGREKKRKEKLVVS